MGSKTMDDSSFGGEGRIESTIDACNLFIVTEGHSEIDYFRRLKDNHLVKRGYNLQIYPKNGIDIHDSNRFNMIEIAKGYCCHS